MSHRTPTKVEFNIRGLTTAIRLMQPSDRTASVPPLPATTLATSTTALSRAYNHIAILLTQEGRESGQKDVAVTGRFSSAGMCVNALKISEDPPHVPSVSVTPDSGSEPSGPQLFNVKSVQPSGKSLQVLADPEQNSPMKPVSLRDHVSDLLQALMELSDDYDVQKKPFFRFIWLQCHRTMMDVLTADNLIVGEPLSDLLRRWKPQATDIVQDQWFGVRRVFHGYLDKRGVPYRSHSGKFDRQYQFSIPTLVAWRALFADTLGGLRELAMGWNASTPSSSLIDEITSALWAWDALVHDNKALNALLDVPSLQSAIYHARLVARGLQTINEHGKYTFITVTRQFQLSPDEGYELDTRDVILRYCQEPVAWLRAGKALSRSRFFKASLPRLNVIHVYKPPNSRMMTSPRDIMLEIILPKLITSSANDISTLIQRRIDQDDFKNSTEFSGTIHCQASLMGLIYSFSPGVSSTSIPTSASAPPLSKDTTEILQDIFTNADSVVGVGRKCCLCCYWLAQALTSENDRFLVPETNGIVLPWTPPSYGIPLEILEQIEEKLVLKLTEDTRRFVLSGRQSMARSQSPGSDSGYSFDLPPFMMKWDYESPPTG
ncbi:hypothetical protein Hypma_016125 [Hypsizygus marmoreus]|uniref:Uncharacterized protein n=1 Tax=Hypsizygus marmoreus TaxID=39966 RepID=A0A369K2S8_HYPMA|nr:hypothetical protein Hypma_016125 [Hypsizygus marmoreus]